MDSQQDKGIGSSKTSVIDPSKDLLEIHNPQLRPLQSSDSNLEEYKRSASDPFHIQDVDSEELEQLEDLAEEEEENREDLERVVQEASIKYPQEVVEQLILDLKRDGLVNFLKNHVLGKDISIKKLLIALGVLLPKSLIDEDVPELALLPILKTALSRILRRRPKLDQYNTVEDAISLIKSSKKIIVLSGAGISVSCGIPDFRSKDGIYSQLQREGLYDLDDPQDMFDKEYFLNNPSCFYSFAHSIYPSNFTPSPSHRFIKLLEEKDLLLRNFTQNIDTLEQEAGIARVLQCHGSFSKASCVSKTCNYVCRGEEIRDAIFERRVPLCPKCNSTEDGDADGQKKKKKSKKSGWGPGGDGSSDEDAGFDLPLALREPCLKPSITFFGEPLSDEFDRCLFEDRDSVDLLIVMGTSLKVAPVSELVAHLPHTTPVILINRTPILHISMDIQLLGDADFIVQYLCHKLGWSLPPPKSKPTSLSQDGPVEENKAPNSEISEKALSECIPERVGESHAWLFPGADTEGLFIEGVDSEDEDDDEGVDKVETEGPGLEFDQMSNLNPEINSLELPSVAQESIVDTLQFFGDVEDNDSTEDEDDAESRPMKRSKLDDQ